MQAIRSQMARSGVVSTSTLQPRGEGGGDNVSASQRVQEVRLVKTATQSDADQRSLQEVYEVNLFILIFVILSRSIQSLKVYDCSSSS